ncbi:hypothetical protein [Bradyrhizobium sp. dw_411]|uniref:hypothetical protein n=1 Tax=Bradyrhizobium sp. dw_411 TaxID=2720082 RepID=UPI001BCCF738|nr:hypothetical protein [Bradyrhizobium sp. dw_411]
MTGWRIPDLEPVFSGIDTHEQNAIHFMSVSKDGHFGRLKAIRALSPLEFARDGLWNVIT